jgi:hypothetical protein
MPHIIVRKVVAHMHVVTYNINIKHLTVGIIFIRFNIQNKGCIPLIYATNPVPAFMRKFNSRGRVSYE